MRKEVFGAPTVYSPIRYAQGIKTTGGTIVWISGQVSQDKHGKMVHKGDFAGQARQALSNLKAMVEAAGGTINDIIKVNTYLTDLRYREELARVRAEFFPEGRLPASTLVGVTALADPDMLVEIEAIAVLPES
ncbi:MAG TPA: RidA family protein [Candidatus Tectomicrobia bacterium]|jgi:2-iminobutanoate/2-iminopropanoate deaminase|nr:RidA family protein [Candidatus Tectomicrobia bacterium]